MSFCFQASYFQKVQLNYTDYTVTRKLISVLVSSTHVYIASAHTHRPFCALYFTPASTVHCPHNQALLPNHSSVFGPASLHLFLLLWMPISLYLLRPFFLRHNFLCPNDFHALSRCIQIRLRLSSSSSIHRFY